MKYVSFHSHTQDYRELSTADLESVGVEGFETTTFRVGVPVEVYVRVAKALVGHPEIFGNFSMSDEITPEEEAEMAAEAEEEARAQAAAEAQKEEKVVVDPVDEPSGTPQQTLGATGKVTSGKVAKSSTP